MDANGQAAAPPFSALFPTPSPGRNRTNDPDLTAADVLRELGYEEPTPPPAGTFPAGGDRWVVPHFFGFSGLFNFATRVYRYTHDEALRNSRINALAMRRDIVIKDALRTRQRPVCMVPWHLEPQDESDPQQLELTQILTKIIQDTPKLQQLKRCLLEAIWYGRAAVNLAYHWDYSLGYRRMVIRGWQPVNGDKLSFKWGGREGILVHATYGGDVQVTDVARAHFFDARERECYVIHEFEPEDADFFEPEMGGAVRGSGLRGTIYWFWLMRNTVYGLLLDYLQRTASGFTVYYYQAGNKNSFDEVSAAAKAQLGKNVIIMPRLDVPGDRGPGVDRVEPSQSGAMLFRDLVMNYYDAVIRRFILGYTMTNELGAVEVGGDAAGAIESHLSAVTKYDAFDLDATFNRDLLPVLARWNRPGVPPPRYVSDVDKPNVGEYMGAVRELYEMGAAIDEDDLRSVVGLPKPEAGHAVLSKMQELSASTMGMTPEGVPVGGATGPVPPGTDPDAAPDQGQPVAAPPEAEDRVRGVYE